MIKLIFKTSLFVVPFLLLYLVNLIFYIPKKNGDLYRVGLLADFSNVKTSKIYQDQLDYPNFNLTCFEDVKASKNKYKLLVIGDSFSQYKFNYHNRIYNEKDKVINLDRKLQIENNQIQTIYNLINTKFFDTIKVERVLLEIVERFVPRVSNCNTQSKEKVITKHTNKAYSKSKESIQMEHAFFNRNTIEVPLSTLLHYFARKSPNSKTIPLKTKQKLFTKTNSNRILISQADFQWKKSPHKCKKNTTNVLKLLNEVYDSLKIRDIALDVMIVPNKYTVYQSEILKKKDISPVFKTIENSPKKFRYINVKNILINNRKKKDLFYYGDTHLSSIGHKIIAQHLQDKYKY